MPNWILVPSSSFVRIILFGILILACISMTNKYPYSVQHDRSHIAKAIAPKYPEVGLPSPQGPIIVDPNLRAEAVFRGLRYPTSMAFLGPNDMLVLEKDQGTVQRIANGNMLAQPILSANVATEGEKGMLGIAITKHMVANGNTFVFLYYTENNGSGSPLGNRVYRYELVDNKLINPKLILNLPATPGPFHDGGKVLIGPDKNVYAVIGDLLYHRTQAQNVATGGLPDLTSGIIRVTEEGKAVPNSPI